MKVFKFKKIDAFATEKSSGNSAGMVYLDTGEKITPDEMQQIAKELKGFVSEVGFVRQLNEKCFDLKYYSSEREVDFCGHATIAIMYQLIKNSDKLIHQKELEIRTPKGNLPVENKVQTEDSVFISAPLPVFSKNTIRAEHIAKALKIPSDAIHPNYSISIVNAGLETLILPIKGLSEILSISPGLDGLKKYCVENNIDIITVFSDEVADHQNAYRSRVYAPAFGYLEDPATGSGNAALGYYLLKHKLWDGALITIEQNASLVNPNIIKLSGKHSGSRLTVKFGGNGITRFEGEYYLY